ncbi:hypothetical protein LCGC14_2422130, partial [marine sediment metagenome]
MKDTINGSITDYNNTAVYAETKLLPILGVLFQEGFDQFFLFETIASNRRLTVI